MKIEILNAEKQVEVTFYDKRGHEIDYVTIEVIDDKFDENDPATDTAFETVKEIVLNRTRSQHLCMSMRDLLDTVAEKQVNHLILEAK